MPGNGSNQQDIWFSTSWFILCSHTNIVILYGSVWRGMSDVLSWRENLGSWWWYFLIELSSGNDCFPFYVILPWFLGTLLFKKFSSLSICKPITLTFWASGPHALKSSCLMVNLHQAFEFQGHCCEEGLFSHHRVSSHTHRAGGPIISSDSVSDLFHQNLPSSGAWKSEEAPKVILGSS